MFIVGFTATASCVHARGIGYGERSKTIHPRSRAWMAALEDSTSTEVITNGLPLCQRGVGGTEGGTAPSTGHVMYVSSKNTYRSSPRRRVEWAVCNARWMPLANSLGINAPPCSPPSAALGQSAILQTFGSAREASEAATLAPLYAEDPHDLPHASKGAEDELADDLLVRAAARAARPTRARARMTRQGPRAGEAQAGLAGHPQPRNRPQM